MEPENRSIQGCSFTKVDLDPDAQLWECNECGALVRSSDRSMVIQPVELHASFHRGLADTAFDALR